MRVKIVGLDGERRGRGGVIKWIDWGGPKWRGSYIIQGPDGATIICFNLLYNFELSSPEDSLKTLRRILQPTGSTE